MLKQIALVMLILIGLSQADNVSAAEKLTTANIFNITQGTSRLITLNFAVRNIAVGNPSVADVLLTSAKELLINAKAAGITTLTIWDSQRNYDYIVAVNKGSNETYFKMYRLQNIDLIRNSMDDPNEMRLIKSEPAKETIDDLKAVVGCYLDASHFSISPWTNSIMVVGSAKEHKMIEEILVNLDKKEKQILLEVEVYELKNDTSLENELQVLYGKDNSLDNSKIITDFSGKFDKSDGGLNYTFNSKGYTTGGAIAEYTTTILKVLETENKARVLARPKILSMNGKHSYILAGEKIPVQRVDKQGNVSVEYLPTGVLLGVVPRLNKEGFINCWLTTQVSSISGYDKNGNPIIGSRETMNDVRLKDKETLVLGGLLKETENTGYGKIPILGDLLGWVPILGDIVNNKNSDKSTTELVITLKPQVVFDDNSDSGGQD